MTVEVKICGVRTPAILDSAIGAGADFVGFVFFEKSPRHVRPEEAKGLVSRARGRARTVVVTVNPDDELVDLIAKEIGPDVLQLHGTESADRVAAIRTRTGLAIMKAVPVAEKADVDMADAYRGLADTILFDTKAPKGADLPGGNGALFDWTMLQGVRAPFALSGGLDAGNVGEALEATRASLVDVSSGVESAPGRKDAGLISDFIQAVRKAAPSHKKAS